MRCKRVREVLLTDYMDNETTDRLRHKIDKHISACAECRAYKDQIFDTFSHLSLPLRTPFPQEDIWHSIDSEIADKAKAGAKGITVFTPAWKKGVFVFASAAALLLMVITFKFTHNNYIDDLGSFFAEEVVFLNGLSSAQNQGVFEQPNFNTAIEEYFL
jgi:hypothetical protein